MTTMQNLIRILTSAGVQPDTVIACNIHVDTTPDMINVLVEDGIAYITEKR
jgi:cysteinyl-tRNA synthetase